ELAMSLYDSKELLQIAHNGLEGIASRSRRVIVVGAGMAGLSAAYELRKAGHEPFVLEAQGRVGGRVYTMREPFTNGLFAEAGAMRIPQAHTLTHAYIDKFELKTAPFTMGNPNGYYYVNGRLHRIKDVERDFSMLGFGVAESEIGRTALAMWADAVKPFATRIECEGEECWDSIVAEYDKYSTREFLEIQGWSEGLIEAFGLLGDQEALMNSAFLEILREEVGGFYTNMVRLEGGMDNLPRAFLPALKDHIRFGAKMVAIDQTPDEVTVYYQTATGRYSMTGDYAIITVPFPVLRHVEVMKPFSSAKRKAIRQLHYDASAKILLQFRRRFWEEDDGIFGGGSVTDLPIRVIYYPEHGRESGRGVVLASYTWSEDAQRWGSLDPRDRISQALENLSCIHPQVRDEFEVGASKMWHDDEFQGGAFALFDPGQQTLLYKSIVEPEGRIYFAGEHTSLCHAWIQGAIESGLRAAKTIHELPYTEFERDLAHTSHVPHFRVPD
ncbi:MAG: flavin monoamine oxidase family protein, partial [Chloroflexia bacterium]